VQVSLEPVKELKVTTLADNLTFHGSLLGQWGLSLLLEIRDMRDKEHKILLDTGAEREALIINVDRLKVDLRNLEAIVLSHGHADHTAATVELARRSRHKVRVIAHPYAFKRRFVVTKDGKRRHSRIPKGERREDIERAGAELMLTDEPCQIIPGVQTTGEIPRRTKFERIPGKRFIFVGRHPEPDLLLDDQALVVNVSGQGAWVLCGCAHSGIINTLNKVRDFTGLPIHAVIGGFHLVSRRESEIQPIVSSLRFFSPKLISPCHCTGFRATKMILDAVGQRFILNFSGRTIESSKATQPSML